MHLFTSFTPLLGQGRWGRDALYSALILLMLSVRALKNRRDAQIDPWCLDLSFVLFDHWPKQHQCLIDLTSSVSNWAQNLTVTLEVKCFLMDNLILLSYRLSPCRHKENVIPLLFREFSKIIEVHDWYPTHSSQFPKYKAHIPCFPARQIIYTFLWVCSNFSQSVIGKTWPDTACSSVWSCTQNYFKCLLLPVKHARCMFSIAIWPLWGMT